MKKKIASIILGIMMLAQICTITSFAEDRGMTWLLEPAEREICRAKYETEYMLENFIFMDTQTGKKGIIDRKGNIVKDAQLEFSGILYYYGDKYMQVYKTNADSSSSYAVLNTKGETVIDFGIYDRMEKISDDIIIAKKGDLYGIITPTGKVRADFIYSEISMLTQNQYLYDDINYVCAKKGEKYGVIDADGKVIIPFEHDSFIRTIGDGRLYTINNGYSGQKTYLMDSKGKILVDGDINQIGYNGKVISVSFKNNSSPVVYVDKDGKILKDYVDTSYIGEYYIFFETDKYYCVFKDGKYGLADKNMNILIPVKYDALYKITDEIFATKESEYAEPVYIDAKGNPLEYMNKYSAPVVTSAGFVIGKDKKTGNCGLTDKSGNILIPFEYYHIYEITDNVFGVNTYSKRTGVAVFGEGTKVKDTFDGLTLQINSKTASVYYKDVEMDVAPIIRDGRTMLPARFVAENLGAEVSWDGATQTVIIKKGSESIHIKIGSTEARVEGYRPYTVQLDAPAFIENGRTYTPVRFIAERLGADVFWDATTKTVKILKK